MKVVPGSLSGALAIIQREFIRVELESERAFSRGTEAMRMAVLDEFVRWFLAGESGVTFVRALRVLSVGEAKS